MAGLIGDLVNPPVATWLANAKAIDAYAASNNYKQAHQLADTTRANIKQFHENLDQWKSDLAVIESLGPKIAQHPTPPEVPQLQGYLAKSQEALDSARINHAKGDSLYAEQLTESSKALQEAGWET